MKLLKDEIEKELAAVQCFVRLAIAAQKAGYLKAAQFFITKAQEDCGHAFLYAKELDKYGELDGDMTATELAEKYYNLEHDAAARTVAIKKQIIAEGKEDLVPFMQWAIQEHSDEAYTAQKLLQQISILDKQEAIKDIEDIFEELTGEES